MGFALIERYIFKKAAISVIVAAAALIAVMWVIRALQQVDVLLHKGQGIATYLKMTTLGVPTLMAAIIPVALLIGLLQTINGLNKDSELVVIHASGASRSTLLKPFVALSLTVSLIVMVLQLWVGPLSMQSLRTYVTKVRADLVSIIVQEGKFETVGDGVVFHIASRAPGGLLKGIFIYDNRDMKQSYTYMSKEGMVSKIDNRAYLILDEGQIHRRDGKDGSVSIVKFNSYAFNLSDFAAGSTGKGQSQMEIDTLDLFYPDKNDNYFKHYPGRYRAELHARLTGALYPLVVGLTILSFLGNPISHRQGQSVIIIVACCTILFLRGMTVFGESALRTNENMLYLVWGLPMFNIICGWVLLATDRSAIPPEMLSRADSLLHRIALLLEPMRARILGDRLGREAAT
jgi:lipopolysaccharide export system permease protein